MKHHAKVLPARRRSQPEGRLDAGGRRTVGARATAARSRPARHSSPAKNTMRESGRGSRLELRGHVPEASLIRTSSGDGPERRTPCATMLNCCDMAPSTVEATSTPPSPAKLPDAMPMPKLQAP